MPDLFFPAELIPDSPLHEALGYMNFQTGPLSHLLRKCGKQIKTRAEDEQAFVLHWFVTLALEHGSEWRKVVSAEIKRMLEEVEAKETAASGGGGQVDR